METENGKRSKTEMFLMILTDALATMYPATGLPANQAVSLETMRARMDAAGLLDDPAED